MRETLDVLDAADVERMLGFAFGWAVGYEAAARAWTPDRRKRLAMSRRAVRADVGESPYIASVEPGGWTNGPILLRFTLGNVPAENEFDEWRRQVNDALRSGSEGSEPLHLADDGTLTVYLEPPMGGMVKEVETTEEMEAAAARCASLLKEALEQVATGARRSPAPKSAEAAYSLPWEVQTYDGLSDSHRAQLPDWVEGITKLRMGTSEFVVVRVSSDALALTYGEPQKYLQQLVEAAPGVTACFRGGDCELRVQPVLEPDDLVYALRSTDPVVSVALGRRRQQVERRRQQKMAAVSAARRVIRAGHTQGD